MGICDDLTDGASNPILQQGGSGAIDEGKAGPVSIIKFGASDYRMWHEAVNLSFTVAQVAYATSTDGTSWTKQGSVFTATETWENDEVCPDTVMYDEYDHIFKMWYHGGFNSSPRKIGLAYSNDGLTWTRQNSSLPVLSTGSAGAWDEHGVADACVLRLGQSDYRMWYKADNNSGVINVGYATSTDGISWTKYASNPVFSYGAGGQWDASYVSNLSVLQDKYHSSFHAWYAGDNHTNASGIGYAWSADGITWVRGANNPLLSGTYAADPTINDPVFAYYDGNSVRIVYDVIHSGTVEDHHEASVTLNPGIVTSTESVRTGTTDPHTFNVTPLGLPRGIAVSAIHGTSSTDHVVSVTYGGVAMTRVQRNTDTSTEPGAAEWWFLGSGIPTGTQTVSVDLSSATTDDIQFVCVVLWAKGDMECIATGGVNEDAANPSVTLTYRGKTAIALGALYGGGAAPSSFTPNANTSAVLTEDLGAFYAYTMVQTTPGTSDFAIGGTASIDDVAFSAIALAARTSEAVTTRRRRQTRTLSRL